MAGAGLDTITDQIVDAALKLHVGLGPGFLEPVYEIILARELARRGLVTARQVPISFDYEGMHFHEMLRADLLVENKVLVEVKSVETPHPVHTKQLLTYLRLADLRVGLLINFGMPTLKAGLERVVNRLNPSASPRLRVNNQGGKAS
jgi:GxxExxY protein